MFKIITKATKMQPKVGILYKPDPDPGPGPLEKSDPGPLEKADPPLFRPQLGTEFESVTNFMKFDPKMPFWANLGRKPRLSFVNCHIRLVSVILLVNISSYHHATRYFQYVVPSA